MAKNAPIVGLDIGTTKICCIIGEVNEEGGIDIIGIGQHPSRGLRKGVVVNIETTVESIKCAVEEAELMAGMEIDSVYVGIAGGHIKGFNSHGIIAVKNKEVTQPDILRVIDAAKALAIPMDREVIHVLPQEFIVDDQDGIKSPLGMHGVRLEVKVHIVTGAVTSAQNIVKSVNKAGLQVNDIVLQPLASSEAVLTPEERELGVAMVDIGGGTSDIALFSQDAIKHTSVLAIGGDHLTNDIAIGLRTPHSEAEKIKKAYGCAIAGMVKDKESIEVPSVGGREPRILSREILAEIIEPRVVELYDLLKREITASGYEDALSSGLVITGGTVIMEGMLEAAERAFQLPVRRGYPRGIGGLVDVVNSPMYATSVGLLLYGHRKTDKKDKGQPDLSGRNMFNKIFSRMKGWVEEFF
ncbi:MAG: cell division protein FtsA [Nitrospinae bacterium]|nr:cell division protein FtsA [Nitrospinota bacterium]